jgi:hypothetical protein
MAKINYDYYTGYIDFNLPNNILPTDIWNILIKNQFFISEKSIKDIMKLNPYEHIVPFNLWFNDSLYKIDIIEQNNQLLRLRKYNNLLLNPLIGNESIKHLEIFIGKMALYQPLYPETYYFFREVYMTFAINNKKTLFLCDEYQKGMIESLILYNEEFNLDYSDKKYDAYIFIRDNSNRKMNDKILNQIFDINFINNVSNYYDTLITDITNKLNNAVINLSYDGKYIDKFIKIIIIMLRHVNKNGTFILKIRYPMFKIEIDIISLLFKCFKHVNFYKPTIMNYFQLDLIIVASEFTALKDDIILYDSLLTSIANCSNCDNVFLLKLPGIDDIISTNELDNIKKKYFNFLKSVIINYNQFIQLHDINNSLVNNFINDSIESINYDQCENNIIKYIKTIKLVDKEYEKDNTLEILESLKLLELSQQNWCKNYCKKFSIIRIADCKYYHDNINNIFYDININNSSVKWNKMQHGYYKLFLNITKRIMDTKPNTVHLKHKPMNMCDFFMTWDSFYDNLDCSKIIKDIVKNKFSFNNSINLQHNQRKWITNAWLKLYEILNKYPQLIQSSEIYFKTFHICESPGSFILCMDHLISKNKNIKWEWYAQTLNPNIENALNDYFGLINKYNDKWLFGEDSTGDITNKNNIKYYWKNVQNINFITADGGLAIPPKKLNEQELYCGNLIYSELLVILGCLNLHGHAILKMFLPLYEPFTILCIILMMYTFNEIHFVKPICSNPSNSEIYVLMINFSGINKKILNQLLDINFNKSDELHTIIKKNFDKLNNFDNLRQKIMTIADIFIKNQINNIIGNYYYYYKLSYKTNLDELNTMKKNFIDKWCQDNL